MHSIRSKAHRAAWRTKEGATNYNPFSRTRPLSHTDIEDHPNLRRYRSEADAHQTIEEQRFAESRQTERDFPAPRHADTAPSTTTEKAPILDFEKPNASGPRDAETLPSPGTGEQSRSPSENSVPATQTSVSGARKRKFLNFLPPKHHEKENSENGTAPPPADDANFKDMDREERKKAALKRKIPVGAQLRAVFFGAWINLMLVFVPVGFVLYYVHLQGVVVFIINFLAIIPLAAILSYATEELALRVGETMGGLLNASFGNAVELIVSVQALIKNEITIVKTSLIGSMLSNLLLVMGMAFFLGGITRLEQYFNVTVAQTAASLLALCIGSVIIPTVFHLMLTAEENNEGNRNQELSRGTAIILLLVYAAYLIFQLKSHTVMYNAPSQKVPKRKSGKIEEGAAARGIATIGAGTAAASGGRIHENHIMPVHDEEEEEEEIEEPQLSVIGALLTLALSTTLVAFCSEFMVSSIESVTEGDKVTKTFVGLILLPIVGNAAEHATAVTVAMKDKMDLAIGVAVGSSMQIALLVLPLIVVLGWILDNDCMTLYFDTFQIAVLFVAVLLVNYLIQDGKSHWLEGVLLIASYLIIALSAWFYPHETTDSRCPEKP